MRAVVAIDGKVEFMNCPQDNMGGDEGSGYYDASGGGNAVDASRTNLNNERKQTAATDVDTFERTADEAKADCASESDSAEQQKEASTEEEGVGAPEDKMSKYISSGVKHEDYSTITDGKSETYALSINSCVQRMLP